MPVVFGGFFGEKAGAWWGVVGVAEVGEDLGWLLDGGGVVLGGGSGEGW